jgi:hypothetical protein
MSTKHPGFAEEREWRLIHTPEVDPSEFVLTDTVCVNRIPQRIYKIPLRDFSDRGFPGTSIPELVNRVIVGPTQYPYVVCDAFASVLSRCGVTNAHQIVHASNIPLRT